MQTLTELLTAKSENLLSIYLTAGYPTIKSTPQLVSELEDAGVDFIELGIPFSDPLADGPTIQEASTVALQNGMNVQRIFECLDEIRKKSSIPVVLMGYLNPIEQFGLEEFLIQSRKRGVDTLIIPDITPEIYRRFYKPLFEVHDMKLVFLITPNTSVERIREIVKISSPFVYLVSSASVTGSSNAFSSEQLNGFRRISAMQLTLPVMVGFGIHNHDTYQEVCQYFNGAIIGSAFIRTVSRRNPVSEFINQLRPKEKDIV